MWPHRLVFATNEKELLFRGRTLRTLPRDASFVDATAGTIAVARALELLPYGGVWVIRASTIPLHPGFQRPASSATKKALFAFGAMRADSGWDELLATTGGLFDGATLPFVASLYCDDAARERLTRALKHLNFEAAVREASQGARCVRLEVLDVCVDEGVRVAQIVTSLQQGGAERVVLDLDEELPARGITSKVISIGRPTRASYPAPPGFVDVSGESNRISAAARAAMDFGADVVHAHLLTARDLAQLATYELPVAVTVHNTREGWPVGLEALAKGSASLLIACSEAVEKDLVDARLPAPVRTIVNGIDARRVRAKAGARAQFRRANRLGVDDVVLLAVGNPRPQKRFDRLAQVLEAARADERLEGREVKLVVVGDRDPSAPTARAALEAMRTELASRGLAAHVRETGSLDDVAPALAAADVLVSVSFHEGLSLAHLEALAAGLPVVALDAGGTREIATNHRGFVVLPQESPLALVAHEAVTLALDKPHVELPPRFTRAAMVDRHALFYRRLAARDVPAPRGLLLVTNNLSRGGAQTSARKLLSALHANGERVRAAVLDEEAPTPNRRALEALGVEVIATPPASGVGAARAIESLLHAIDACPPEAILLWNVTPESKLRLADALLETPIVDVSPGEMFFASLERWFSRPLGDLPYSNERAYARLLRSIVVKYEAEVPRAGALGRPVSVVRNGVPRRARASGSTGKQVVFGTSARLAPHKRIDLLIDALRLATPRLGPHVLRVAGGPEHGSEAHAAELEERGEGLSIEWLGDLDGADAFLDGLDVFVMLAEPAGCPNASLEAVAAGLPLIITDHGGGAEQVIDGETGILVPRDDVGALAAAMVRLAESPALRASMSEASSQVLELFSMEQMIEGYRAVLASARRRE